MGFRLIELIHISHCHNDNESGYLCLGSLGNEPSNIESIYSLTSHPRIHRRYDFRWCPWHFCNHTYLNILIH